MKITKKIWIILAVVVAVIAIGLFIYFRNQSSQQTQYQTAPASRQDLTASVGATGTVRAVQSAELNWQTSGVVEKVTVKIGDSVKPDQILANLVQTSMSQSVIMAEVDLINAQNDMDDLMHSTLDLSQAQLDLANAKQSVQDAQDKVDSLTFQRADDNLIKQTQANIDLARKELALASDNYKHFAKRPDGDADKASALLRLTTAQQSLDDYIQKYDWYTGRPTDLDAETYLADLALAKSQQADAQRQVDRLIGGIPQSDIDAINARIAAAKSTINMGKIISPFAGTVTQVDAVVGDLVTPTTFAVRVDDLSRLLIDLQISEVDINNLAVDQPVQVSFDALQGNTYNGKVVKISQNGTSTGSGVNFGVTVELTDDDETIKPGMTAAVSITVKQIPNALFVENRSVRTLNGKKVVYILRDNAAVAVEVRLGATADNVTEVIGGDLKEGDLVILNPPSANKTMFGG